MKVAPVHYSSLDNTLLAMDHQAPTPFPVTKTGRAPLVQAPSFGGSKSNLFNKGEI